MLALQSQAWWTDPGTDLDSQSKHVHLGACVPLAHLGGTVSDTLTVDVLIQLHNLNVSWDTRKKQYSYPGIGVSLLFLSDENTTWPQSISARCVLSPEHTHTRVVQ